MDTTYNIKRLRNQFLKSYHNSELIKAVKYGTELIECCKKNNLDNTVQYGNNLFNIACAYDESGMHDKAIRLYLKAADIEERLNGKSAKLSDIYSNIGVAHTALHQMDTALAYFKKCYNIRNSNKDTAQADINDACYNLGSVYKALHRLSDAAMYYAKSLNGRSDKNLSYADNLYNLGMCYIHMKSFDIGINYIEKALPIYKAITANPEEYASALSLYASMLFTSGKYSQALDSYNSLIELIKVHFGTDQPLYVNTISKLADCYAKLDDTDRGIVLKQKALNMIKKGMGTSHIFYSVCLSELAELYLQKKDYANAALQYEQALEIRSKILGIDNEECIEYIKTLSSVYCLIKLYKKAEDLLNYSLNNLSQNNKFYGEIVMELVKLYMEMEDGAGLNRMFLIFNRVYPNKSFDEMLDMAEEFEL